MDDLFELDVQTITVPETGAAPAANQKITASYSPCCGTHIAE
ncbi:hypothetical protein ACIG3E_15710 [Streptomyces sp. NPDC053474]